MKTLRAIARMPLVAAVIVVSLGVGIGVNTVVFSWLQARVLHPLPGVARSAALVGVEPRTDRGIYPGTSWLEYRDLRERLTTFEGLIAFRMVPLYLGDPGHVERAYGLLVSDNYFAALGVRPALGRFPRADEVREGAAPVAVISNALWKARYDATPSVLGRTIRANGRELAIVGVAPEPFQGTALGLHFEVWVPATVAPLLVNGSRELEERSIRGYAMLGRLRPSASRGEAQLELDTVMRQLAAAYPATNATMRAEALAFWELPRGPQRMMAIALVSLQGLMLLMLLAVCGNTANLVLARASARQREVGVRLALGAGPGGIARLLLSETVVMAAAGGALGALIARWWTPALVTLPLSGLPVKFTTPVDAAALAFAMLLGVASGLVIGAAPALQLSRVDPLSALRAGAKTAGRSSLRNALMGVQVALAALVLTIAGVAFRSFMQARDTDPGFRRDGVLLGAYDLSGRNATPGDVQEFPARLLEELHRVPFIEAAAIASSVPLDIHGLPVRVFTVEGHTRTDGGYDQAVTNTVTPGYFDLMGIPIVRGTRFAPLTDRRAARQAIVNEEFVARYLSGREPLGRRLQARGRDFAITGVARNSLYNAFGEPPTPAIYFSYRDNPLASGEIHVRTRSGAEKTVTAAVRRAVSALDAELPVFNVRTLDEHVDTNLVFRRVPARLFAVLGPLLLGLVSIGIYAVVAYAVSLRTTEIGVRLAVGATSRRVVAALVGESLRIVVVATLAGWMVALILARQVLGDRFLAASVVGGVPAILLLISTLACWLPARRASRLDPVAALREVP